MSSSPPQRVCVVTGDVMLDWNLAIQRAQGANERSWVAAGKVIRKSEAGGAALLAELVDAIRPPQWSLVRVADPSPAGKNEHLTFTRLSPYGEKGIWRVQDFLGVQKGAPTFKSLKDDTADAELVVLLDTGLGFHDQPAGWPKALQPGSPAGSPDIVLKTCALAFNTQLWKTLSAHHADRLIVVTTVEDLRRMEIEISRHVSWESSAEDLVRELRRNPVINPLNQCRCVVVSFGSAGAVVYSGLEGTARLIFDPTHMESEREDPKNGSTMGNTTILTTAIVHELMTTPASAVSDDAIRRGIAGMDALYRDGYGSTASGQVEFPVKRVATAIQAGPAELVATPIPLNPLPRYWTILTEGRPDDDTAELLRHAARQIVIYGFDAYDTKAPREKIGDLFTLDRREIEPLRSIKSLLKEFFAQTDVNKPLSIAVFGPPGAGKSFAVKEVAKSIHKDIPFLTFNLSQLADPRELYGAFHQVRDAALKGEIPVVFWDEFDSPLHGKKAGWLQYFLAPMQDGTFQQGDVTHPIGKSVFVFAGGTVKTLHDFEHLFGELDSKEAKEAKLPDFRSRLKGFLNIAGPNPSADDGGFFVLRRAILLRSMLERHAPNLLAPEGKRKKLQIDHSVLEAFLRIHEFKHGARSMEALIHMSALAGKNAFERSRLPSEEQLALHVDSRKFMRLVEEPALGEEVVEKMARVVHVAFCRSRRSWGWHYNATRDDSQKRHNLLRPYGRLPESAKQFNRDFIRSIARKLEKIGYAMTPVCNVAAVTSFSPAEIETLAPEEHEEWMERKKAAGFVLPSSPPSPHESPYLVPWLDLPGDMKKTDRDLVAALPKILAAGDYMIVKLKP